MDVARQGATDARALLVVTSACHGAEGYCGSGVQHALLADGAFAREAVAAGIAVLYIHALNPGGFSWMRRATQENVDLNRNFQDFSKPLPANEGYAKLAQAIVPDHWPPSSDNEAQLAAYAARHGAMGLQAAITGGQYTHADGIWYGGAAPTWSRETLERVLGEHGRRCARLGWIDLHTGLGPNGHGERIFAGPDDAATVARARAWWGAEVTSIYDGSSTSAPLTGMLFEAACMQCPQAEYTGIAIEYGTLPVPEVLMAMRGDQWLENHPQADAATRATLKRMVREAFYTETDEWKTRILEQAVDAARQGLRGLAAT
jgi:hypothetical protein